MTIVNEIEVDIQKSTRDRILEQALILFGESGFSGVSMRDIADRVGIKAASIYNHFSGKDEIFAQLFDEMELRYDKYMDGIMQGEGDQEFFGSITFARLADAVEQIFLYFLTDTMAAPFRKMLTIEQNRSSLAANGFRSFLIERPLEYQTEIFRYLKETGQLQIGRPELAALHFYGPIYLLLQKYDNQLEKLPEALEEIREHVAQFSVLYHGGRE
ncbi:MAG: TetR/AcrR family transcriptional regulator [Tissierellia bacterium]|nr:TetR/AcrR family transcriptional regulator [Tissierellia bacterium]